MSEKKGDALTENNGYTLIEVIIVLMVTAVAFVSIYALFAKSMKYNTEGRYEIIAAELAQEGVEIIKNRKEKNEMDWAVWNGSGDLDELGTFESIDSLSDCNPSLSWNEDGSGYSFECNTSNTKMQYDSESGQYKVLGSCAEGIPCFDRKCATEVDDNGDKALQVVCTVSWGSSLLGGDKRKVTTQLILTDWER